MTSPAPQTKREIAALLKAAGVRPNRRRGQSFLIDGNLMRQVAAAAELTGDEVVIEVGTGTGSLTRLLAAEAAAVVTVEIDSGLARVAAQVLRNVPNVTLLHADVLAGKHALNPDVLAAVAARTPMKLVANLPYSIATSVVLNLLFETPPPERMVFTVQREVAERLTATPGTRDYGWASVVVAVAGQAEIRRGLPPDAFWPKPAVTSSLVVMQPRCDWRRDVDVDRFRTFGAFVFQQRRKTALRIVREALKRTTAGGDAALLLASCGIAAKTRGDQLTPEHIVKLSRHLA